MKSKIFIKVAFFVSVVLTFAASKPQPHHKEVLNSFLVESTSPATMYLIALKYEITAHIDNTFTVLVLDEQVADFMKLAPQATLLQHDINADLKRRVLSKKGTIAGYHSYAEVGQYLKDVVKNHPDIAKLEIYGQSTQGQPLYALKLSDNVGLEEFEPRVMITAATHGDELITVEVMITLIDKLLTSYQKDDRLTKFIDQRELYFIPVVNPDGFVQQDRYDNEVDPNRNYPWPGNPTRQPIASIAALIKFFNLHNFSGTLDMHAFGGMIMFPWAYTESLIKDADYTRFSELATHMAEDNGYDPGPISHVVYLAPGSSADYYYWKTGAKAFAYEMGNEMAPDPSQIPVVARQVTESTWRFLESFE